MRLSKLKFKEHPILKDLEIDFTDKSGTPYQNIVLVGENGCGKTTILNELNNFNDSKYITDKLDSLQYYIKGHKFQSIHISQDVKYQHSLNAISYLISSQPVFQIANETQNTNFDDRLKNNKVNSKELLKQEILELDNKALEKIIKDDVSISKLLSGIGGLLKINDDNPKMLIDSLSSGEQELALRLLSLKSKVKTNTDLILIDEPETALHPKWQLQIFEFINTILSDITSHERDAQLFIATHSENILKKALSYPNTLVVRLYKKNNNILAEKIVDSDRVLPYISFPEIQYLIFGIPTTDYHNALYGYLIGSKSIRRFENKLINHKKFNNDYYNQHNYYRHGEKETLPTYIRNAIHHPENTDRYFSDEDLIKSIEFLRQLIKYNIQHSLAENDT